MKRTLLLIGLAFGMWRLAIQLVVLLAPGVLVFAPSYPYAETLLRFGPWWLTRWAGFDGVHYFTIAMKGYFGTGLIQAFFPLYPLLVRGMTFFIHNVLLSGLLVSHVFALFALYIFMQLLKKEKLDISAGLISLLLFPTAFFLVGFYTESLFLFLTVSAICAVKKQSWIWAVLCTALATATRLTGVFLIPALIIEMIHAHRMLYHSGYPWKNIVFALCGSAGLVVYMVYLQRVFGDPLYFFHVQAAFNTGRQENLVLFPQVVYRYFRILTTVPFSLSYYAYAQELFVTGVAGVLLTLATVKKWLRPSLLIYSWGSYLLPPLTGTFQSMPRYLLTIFPLFFILAKLRKTHPVAYTALTITHAILLVINIVLFIQGRWVA